MSTAVSGGTATDVNGSPVPACSLDGDLDVTGVEDARRSPEPAGSGERHDGEGVATPGTTALAPSPLNRRAAATGLADSTRIAPGPSRMSQGMVTWLWAGITSSYAASTTLSGPYTSIWNGLRTSRGEEHQAPAQPSGAGRGRYQSSPATRAPVAEMSAPESCISPGHSLGPGG